MIEVVGNFWDYPADIKFITTNGNTTTTGSAIMGKGLAEQAANRIPYIRRILGKKLLEEGNKVHYLCNYLEWRDERYYYVSIYSLPTKYNFWKDSDLGLIKKSLQEVKDIADRNKDKILLMTRPGCGNGNRDWDKEVKPLFLAVKIPDNVLVIDNA